MKRFLVALFSVALLCAACDKYDDSALQSRMTGLEGRVTDLENTVNGINSNVSALQSLVSALQNKVTVDAVTKNENGYTISFSDGTKATVSNGEKGETPAIGVKAEDGVFFWTVNGEWLLDAEGNRVIVTGAVPQVKVEDGKWFVSYDGTNWQEIGTTESISGIVVTEDANFVYLTVPGSGDTVSISKSSRFTIDVASTDYLISAGATTEIPYSISGADGTEKLFIQSNDFVVSYDAQKIYVTPKDGVTSGDILVMAVRNSDQAVCGVVLSFSNGVLEVTSAVNVPAEGGEAEVFIKTNLDYEVVIPEEAAEWLAIAPDTRAVRIDTLVLAVQPNESELPRSAKVEVKPAEGASIFVTVYQYGKEIPSLYPVLTIAEFLALPDDDTEVYQLTGVITAVRHSVNGYFEMKDKTGTVFVFGLKDEDGNDVFTSLGLEEGDKVVLHGSRNVNNGRIEVVNAVYERHIKAADIPEEIEEITIAEFLEKSAGTDVWYKLTGKITQIVNTTYGNFYMEDETGSVYVYGLTATKQETNDKSFSSLGLKVGDTVTAIGYRSDYTKDGVTTIEFGGNTPAYYVSHIPGDGGDEPQPGGGEASGVYTSSIEWSLGTSAYEYSDATINGEDGIWVLKLGTSSKPGYASFYIPAGVSKIGFYAVAWKGLSGVDISFGNGETVTVEGNEGAAGNNPYVISVTDNDYYEIEVSQGDLEISVEKRVVIFGVNPVD